jgi:UDP-2,4-diacetamido-2,4,6-trideoxy-beta-L-altropyranose hydrolase
MEVLFRADASREIGTGHVMRCLTLADALRERGAQCRFICRAHKGNLIELIAQRGYKVHALPEVACKVKSTNSDLAHASWLDTDQATDAAETIDLLGEDMVDWLIVDHYALDHRWEAALRPSCKQIMVIDDLADRRHDCDLLLDQNYGSSAERYKGHVPRHCTQLHGPDYALLKPAYAERRAQLEERTGATHRVLIYFGGGADAPDLTGMALRAFNDPDLASIDLDIVVGAAYSHRASLEDAATKRGRVTIHSQLPHLADLMAKADLAIGAGGATTWERCCMGLPSMVISVADNQRPACQALEKAGLILYLGEASAVSVHQVQQQLTASLKQPETLQRFSAVGMALVDALGTSKVVQAMDCQAAMIKQPIY